jgi:hypothetical protein
MYRRVIHIGRQVNNEVGSTCVCLGAAGARLRYTRNSGGSLEVPKKSTKPQDFRCLGCNSNRISREQKSEVLPPGPSYVVDEKV